MADKLIVIAGDPSGSYGFTDGVGTAARFDAPRSILFATDGITLYVLDYGNKAIRTVNIETGEVATFATFSGDYGPMNMSLNEATGNLWVSCWDTTNTRLYKITPAGAQTVIWETSDGGGANTGFGPMVVATNELSAAIVYPQEDINCGHWSLDIGGATLTEEPSTCAGGCSKVFHRHTDGIQNFVLTPDGAFTISTQDYVYPSHAGICVSGGSQGFPHCYCPPPSPDTQKTHNLYSNGSGADWPVDSLFRISKGQMAWGEGAPGGGWYLYLPIWNNGPGAFEKFTVDTSTIPVITNATALEWSGPASQPVWGCQVREDHSNRVYTCTADDVSIHETNKLNGTPYNCVGFFAPVSSGSTYIFN